MIDEVIADIATKVKAQLPFVKTTQHIARQDPTGIILIERPEDWAGIDDRHDGNMYIRFREGWETMFSAAALVSAKDTTVTKRMRAVFMHYCTNEHEIERFLSFGIMNCVNHQLRYTVTLRNASTDKQFILAQETKQTQGKPENRLRLVMVDFDVSYRDSLLTTGACVPNCDGC